MTLPGDPYLPGGCTQADLDRAMGVSDDGSGECEWCGGLCRGTICKRCAAEERAERMSDEERDGQ